MPPALTTLKLTCCPIQYNLGPTGWPNGRETKEANQKSNYRFELQRWNNIFMNRNKRLLGDKPLQNIVLPI